MFSKFKSFSSFRQTSTTALTLIFLCGFHLPALAMDDNPSDKEPGSRPAQQVNPMDTTGTTHQETQGIKRKREDAETNPGPAEKKQHIETLGDPDQTLGNPDQYLKDFRQDFIEYRAVKASTRATPLKKEEAKRLKADLRSGLKKRYNAGVFVTPDQRTAAFHCMAALSGDEDEAHKLLSDTHDYITNFPIECVTMIVTNLPIVFDLDPVNGQWYQNLKDVRAFACVNTRINDVVNACIFPTSYFSTTVFPLARDFYILQNQFNRLTELTIVDRYYFPGFHPWDLSRISCLSDLTTLRLIAPEAMCGFVDFYDASLNLQSNTKLTTLMLHEVALADIGGLSNLTGLTDLSLGTQSAGKNLVHPIAKLDVFPNLTALSLRGNTAGPGMDLTAFCKLKKLKVLTLSEDNYQAQIQWSQNVLPHLSTHFPQLEHLILEPGQYSQLVDCLTASDPRVQHLLSHSKIKVTFGTYHQFLFNK